MTAVLDITDGSIRLDKNGYRVDRVALVESVTGSASTRIYNAINDAALPNLGDAHPDISTITLNDISGDIIDPDTVRVVLSYYKDSSTVTGSSNAESSASATTALEIVKTDILGADMSTEYNVNIPFQGPTVVYPTFEAEVEKPRMTFSFSYTAASFPKTEIDSYLGKINSALWNSYAIGTVLCSGVIADQRGDDYLVTFTFTYNPETWKFKAKIPHSPDEISGSTDLSLDTATGIKEFDVYSSVDFTPLGFTL